MLTFFFTFSPKTGARLGMVEGGEAGMLGLTVGTGQKEGSHAFCKVGCLCFWLSGKISRQAAQVPPAQLWLVTPGALETGAAMGPLVVGAQPLHLQTRVRYVHEKKIF